MEDVKYAILENSGQLSVLPWTPQQPPTAAQLHVDVEDSVPLPTVLINDGRVLRKNLAACGHDRAWLWERLREQQLSSPRDIFLLTLDEQGRVSCVKKENHP